MHAAMRALHEHTDVPAALHGQIVGSISRDGHAEDPKRRRRGRRGFAVAAAVGLVAAGSATAAVLVNRQPSTPQFGIVCRAAATIDADAVAVVAPSDNDPLAVCARLWERGQLPDVDAPPITGALIPPLIACIGSGGAIEVFPGLDACGRLGLVPAALESSPETQRIVELQAAVSELNIEGCLAEVAVTERLAELLGELGLERWT
ncbi:MAG: hypothetical protein M3Q82_02840, partial [Actinomycetota bacterium]|nr:hypothetical protein [Actinomycetota bacterium]